MNTAQRLWKTSDNIIMTNFEVKNKNDIQKAFERLGLSDITINFRSNRFHDNGFLATTTANTGNNFENEEWLIIAWELQTEAEKETWLLAGRQND